MFTNAFNIQRGAICVLRYYSDGAHVRLTAFQIAPRANWKEWSGAFSML
jgi:hypothetical protein